MLLAQRCNTPFQLCDTPTELPHTTVVFVLWTENIETLDLSTVVLAALNKTVGADKPTTEKPS